ncbi:gem-associated protein 7 isoform X2 [Rhincodon typus]|uniref:gem-associated protein 7 isoform X2 n=1 Tax=Rhincodon typus TaxID=259920 RepID=UPI00202DFB4A|nr:gem-associated protein 7 isoform X2 [Rhincodon typus]
MLLLQMATPVSVVRLPRGPNGHSRGFDPTSPRYHALAPSSIQASNNGCLKEEQRSRSTLRERFLRSLIVMAGKTVDFTMYERVSVTATFAASDIDILNFQVSHLQTPLGIQKEALLRCPDIIAYAFNL